MFAMQQLRRWWDAIAPRHPSPVYTFWIGRFVLLRMLGVIFAIAFAGLLWQYDGLHGPFGLQPLRQNVFQWRLPPDGDASVAFLASPSLLWLGHCSAQDNDHDDTQYSDSSSGISSARGLSSTGQWTWRQMFRNASRAYRRLVLLILASSPRYPHDTHALELLCGAEVKLLARVGLALSVVMVVGGATNALLCLAIWALYLSVVNAGSMFYAFGWETQMLETLFFAAFLCPIRGWRPFPVARSAPTSPPPSRLAVLLVLWVECRVMLGAGLIKLRGDPCWLDLSCMRYFYETQPIPSALSRLWHRLPDPLLRGGVLVNHAVELVVPPLALLLPLPRVRRLAGALLIAFQCLLLSGNLSWLNWLTMAPCFLCLDDAAWCALLPRALWPRVCADAAAAAPADRATVAGKYAQLTRAASVFADPTPSGRTRPVSGIAAQRRLTRTAAVSAASGSFGAAAASALVGGGAKADGATTASSAPARRSLPRRLLHAVLLLAVLWLSVPVLRNLASSQQSMNRSYNRLHLVNTYGAFGSVQRERREVVLQGTTDPTGAGGWREYDFRCKPGNVSRMPCFLAPYHLRLDWHMWFAAMSSYTQHPWVVRLVWLLLHQRPEIRSLLGVDPFADGPPPALIRARLYRYRFAPGRWGAPWWTRDEMGEYLPPLSRDNPSLAQFLQAHGYSIDRTE